MKASYNGNTEIAKLLLEAGADVNVKNEYGETALDIAESRGRTKITELLKEKKRKMNKPIEAIYNAARELIEEASETKNESQKKELLYEVDHLIRVICSLTGRSTFAWENSKKPFKVSDEDFNKVIELWKKYQEIKEKK
jgi:ankyrin repeat protein